MGKNCKSNIFKSSQSQPKRKLIYKLTDIPIQRLYPCDCQTIISQIILDQQLLWKIPELSNQQFNNPIFDVLNIQKKSPPKQDREIQEDLNEAEDDLNMLSQENQQLLSENRKKKRNYGTLKEDKNIQKQKKYFTLGRILHKQNSIYQQFPILKSSHFWQMSQDALMLLFNQIQDTKTCGLLIVDQFGNILSADKMAYQIFDGGLNQSLQNANILDLMITMKKEQYINQLLQTNKFSQNQFFKWIIYCKSNIRTYKNQIINAQSYQQVFTKYFRHIKTRICPIQVMLSYKQLIKQRVHNYQKFPIGEKIRCFSIQIKVIDQFPNFNLNNIFNDVPLINMMNNNKDKYIKFNNFQKQEINQKEYQMIEQSNIILQKKLNKPKILQQEQLNQLQQEKKNKKNKIKIDKLFTYKTRKINKIQNEQISILNELDYQVNEKKHETLEELIDYQNQQQYIFEQRVQFFDEMQDPYLKIFK